MKRAFAAVLAAAAAAAAACAAAAQSSVTSTYARPPPERALLHPSRILAEDAISCDGSGKGWHSGRQVHVTLGDDDDEVVVVFTSTDATTPSRVTVRSKDAPGQRSVHTGTATSYSALMYFEKSLVRPAMGTPGLSVDDPRKAAGYQVVGGRRRAPLLQLESRRYEQRPLWTGSTTTRARCTTRLLSTRCAFGD